MSCSRMKKILITKVTGLCCVLLIVMSLVSASRSQSVNKVDDFTVELTETDAAGATKRIPKFYVQVTREFGLLSLRVRGNGESIYTKALTGININNKWYTVDKNGGLSTKATDQEIISFNAIIGGTESSCISNFSQRIVKEYDPTLVKGKTTCLDSIPGITAGSGMALSADSDYRFRLCDVADCVKQINGIGRVTVAVAMINNKAAGEGFSFVWTPEYFKGEQELCKAIAKNCDGTYEDEVKELLDIMIFGEEVNGAIENKYKTALAYSLITDLQPLYSGSDASMYFNNIEISLSNFPILTKLDDAVFFKSLYESKSNPYLNKYLVYCYQREKPLYSKKVFSSEKETFGVENYYTSYRSITEDEGKALAQAALKFYCWGVEYTPGPGKGQTLPGVTNIYAHNSQMVKDWILNNADTADPSLDGMPSNTDLGNVTLKGPVAVEIPYKGAGKTGYEAGNPLPYIKGGVDGPRTFAYKMYEQNLACKVLWGAKVAESTRAFTKKYLVKPDSKPAPIEDAVSWYVGPVKAGPNWPVLSDGVTYKTGKTKIKPFIPFMNTDISYKVDRMAGVDATGFFLGSIALSSIRDSFAALGNRQVATSLEAYYAMKNATQGLGVDNRPLFTYGNDLLSVVYYGSYRITRADFEKVSYLVPDLSDVQVGDILIHFGSAEEKAYTSVKDSDYLHIGIVVEKDDTKDFYSGTYVVHTGEGQKKVCLDTLAASGFDKKFQVRRLLVSGDSTSGYVRAKNPSWDVMDDEIQGMSFRIYDTGGLGTTAQKLSERWIPNTGEYKEFEIDISLLNSAGLSCKNSQNLSIKIEPPVDRSLGSATDGQKDWSKNGNIYRNEGDGFELVVRSDSIESSFTSEKATRIAIFERNSTGEYVIKNDPDSLVGTNGILKTAGWEWISVWNDKIKKYQFKLSYQNITYSHFGIRPLAKNIRPGDDIQLKISLYKTTDPTCAAVYSTILDEKYYLAVYDKKMLWRANLYIDEGTSDWNITNPWNAPPTGSQVVGEYDKTLKAWTTVPAPKWWNADYGYNEWNRLYDGMKRLDENNIEPHEDSYLLKLPPGDGRQVVMMNPFTNPPMVSQGNVQNYVAYAYGCNDNPFEYNDELLQQMQICAQHYEANGALKKKGSTSSWSQTTAPGGGKAYAAYYYPSEMGAGLEDDIGYTAIPAKVAKWDIKNPFSFLPGWALTWYKAHKNTAPPDWVNVISTGTDCVGLVQRAAGYTGNKYIYPDIAGQSIYNLAYKNEERYESWYPRNRSHTYKEYSFAIFTENDGKGLNTSFSWDRAKLMVPGDIFQQYGYVSNKWQGIHIGIIHSVGDSNGDGLIASNEIQIVESTWGGGITWAHVTDSQTLEAYEDFKWYINRLQ